MNLRASHSLPVAALVAVWGMVPGCPFDGDDRSDDQVWMSIAPIQCNGNAWEQAGKSLPDYLMDQGAAVHDMKTSTFAGAVCLACSCISGQRVDVLVDEDDAPILLAEGFFRLEDWPF